MAETVQAVVPERSAENDLAGDFKPIVTLGFMNRLAKGLTDHAGHAATKLMTEAASKWKPKAGRPT